MDVFFIRKQKEHFLSMIAILKARFYVSPSYFQVEVPHFLKSIFERSHAVVLTSALRIGPLVARPCFKFQEGATAHLG